MNVLYFLLALLRRKQQPRMKSATATTIGTTIATIIDTLLFPAQVHHIIETPQKIDVIYYREKPKQIRHRHHLSYKSILEG